MIDTISISVRDNFVVSKNAQFVPEFSKRTLSELSVRERTHKNHRVPYIRKFILHPELAEDAPRVPQVEIFEIVVNRGDSISYDLKITCSLTTIFFQNNLEELDLEDAELRDQILSTLSGRLYNVGIKVDVSTLAAASISVLHVSKNIALPTHIRVHQILTELSKLDNGEAYDVTNSENTPRLKNRNNGQVINIRCGTKEYVFYEKISDILKPKTRSADKQKTKFAKQLIDTYNLKDKEVFRFEYRLNKIQTIKSVVNKILNRNYRESVLFADIFSKDLCQKILVAEWQKLLKRPENQLSLFPIKSNLDLLVHIATKAHAQNKNAHSQNKALWIYGLASLIKEVGSKTVLGELGKVWSSKSKERLNDKLSIASALLDGLLFSEGIEFISEQLMVCKIYKPKDHKE